MNTVNDRGQTVNLPASPRSVRDARHLVSDACHEAGFPSDLCDQVILLTSETVTNAVLYGRSDVRLTIGTEPDSIRITVGDDNARSPVLRHHDAAAIDGRGMALVAALADDWGVEPEPCGKRVWFEVRA